MAYVVVAHPVPTMGNGVLLDVRYQQSATPNAGLCMTVYSTDASNKSGDVQPAIFPTYDDAVAAVDVLTAQGYDGSVWGILSLGEFLFGT